jgi:hypothetical protein
MNAAREIVAACFGCEGWCLTLKEEQTMGVFENRVLRGILGTKGSENRKLEKIS